MKCKIGFYWTVNRLRQFFVIRYFSPTSRQFQIRYLDYMLKQMEEVSKSVKLRMSLDLVRNGTIPNPLPTYLVMLRWLTSTVSPTTTKRKMFLRYTYLRSPFDFIGSLTICMHTSRLMSYLWHHYLVFAGVPRTTNYPW